MDLWVIAAAAGAGYAAKNLQNLSADKREFLGGNSLKYSYDVQSESRNFLQQLRDKTCPLRRLAQHGVEDSIFLDVDINSLSSKDRKEGIGDKSLQERLEFEDGGNRNFSRGKLVKDRRCVHPMKPLNSSGSCVENTEQSASLCPSVSTVSPVLVTVGMWGNSSSYVDFDGCREEVKGDNVVMSPSSASSNQFESVEELRKPKKSSSSLQQIGYRDGRPPHSLGPETMFLFFTGMTIGILSATWSWKKEVDTLNNQLKQMDNLVQDLHDELDMKEMLMVKELSDEGGLPSASISSPVEKISESNNLKANEKNAGNLELLSRIEEELQAELEMLEQNMKVSAVERLSSVEEIDPVFEPEIVQGDLKATMVNDASRSETETTDTSNCCKPTNYAVCPRELSLRLHELLESMLEARIKELEIELGKSQHMVSGRRFSYSEIESSSTYQSPTCICSRHDKLHEDASTYKSNNGILHKVIYTDQEKEDGEYRSETLVQDMQQLWDKQRGTSFIYNEDPTSEDEDSDESDMLLIKQIVERRKSSSNFNLRID